MEIVEAIKIDGANNIENGGFSDLLDEAILAWNSQINCHYYFHEKKEVPYEWNERTTCGAFGTALAAKLHRPGSVLVEVDTDKQGSNGRSDIEWVTDLDGKRIYIRFESKQNRVTRRGYLEADNIEQEVFGANGLIALSIRDFGKIQGRKRIHAKSRDDYFHVSLLFIRIVNPLSDLTGFIAKLGEATKRLRKKISIILIRRNEKKGIDEQNGIKNLSKFHSVVYLHVPDDHNVPALITMAIVFRRPA